MAAFTLVGDFREAAGLSSAKPDSTVLKLAKAHGVPVRPVSEYRVASAIKAGAFAGLLRLLVVALPAYRGDWRPVIEVLALLSLFGGAFGAIVQTDVKRMLAYSSINHAGFILVAVDAASAQGISAALFYLAVYSLMTIGAFAVVTVISREGDGHTSLADLRGLPTARPALALALVVLRFIIS